MKTTHPSSIRTHTLTTQYHTAQQNTHTLIQHQKHAIIFHCSREQLANIMRSTREHRSLLMMTTTTNIERWTDRRTDERTKLSWLWKQNKQNKNNESISQQYIVIIMLALLSSLYLSQSLQIVHIFNTSKFPAERERVTIRQKSLQTVVLLRTFTLGFSY